MKNQNYFVAFLRGINVGGKSMVKMVDLRKAFEELGFKNVKTVLNSGNVLFSSSDKDAVKITSQIKGRLHETFAKEIDVIVRSKSDLQKLVKEDPFQNINVDVNTRLYVTFLSEEPTHSFKLPYESPQKDFSILKKINKDLCSVLRLSPKTRTTEAMKIVEKEFGKKVTTRNWNTVLKTTMV